MVCVACYYVVVKCLFGLPYAYGVVLQLVSVTAAASY